MNKVAISFDEKLFLALNGNHSEFLDSVMLLASNLFSCIPIFIFIVFIAAKYYKKQGYSYPLANSVLLTGILLLGFMFCLFVLPPTFSGILERQKPCFNPSISSLVRMVGEDCSNTSSFFAVRPCVMFCITSFLLFTLKKEFPVTKAILIFWSLLVSYSRIYLGAHYPFNILIADLIGFFCGFITSRLYFYMKYDIFGGVY